MQTVTVTYGEDRKFMATIRRDDGSIRAICEADYPETLIEGVYDLVTDGRTVEWHIGISDFILEEM